MSTNIYSNLDVGSAGAYKSAVGDGDTAMENAAQPSTTDVPRRRRPPSYAEQLRRRQMLAPYAQANKRTGQEIREARKQ